MDVEDEVGRLAPVLTEIVALGPPVSIDTMKASVARWALDRGAAIVNDVWGLQRDPDMAPLVADYGAAIVIMHNRHSADPAIDILADIIAFFFRSLDIAARAGVAADRIVLDPGIGFGKTPAQSLEVLGRLGDLRRFRPAALDRRVAQTLHRHRVAGATRAAAWRFARRPSCRLSRRGGYRPRSRCG